MQKGDDSVSRTKDGEFDYQAYMKENPSDLGEIRGPEARQKRREAVIHNNRGGGLREQRRL